MTLNNSQRFLTYSLRALCVGALSLSAVACGGGLSHTVDDSSMSAEQRKQLSAQNSDLEKADGTVNKRAEEQAQAGNRVEAAKAQVAKKEKELAIAKAKLDVEEAKEEAAAARKTEAEKGALVAQAKLELKKLKTIGPSEGESAADYKEKVAEFEKQLAASEMSLAESKQDAANKERSIEEAKSELAGMQQ